MQRQYSNQGKSSHMLSQMWRRVCLFIPPISPQTTRFPHRSPNSCFQRTRRLLQGRQCSWVWTGKEWGRSRETEERISSVRLTTVRGMEREKKLTQTIFVATCYWITAGCYYLRLSDKRNKTYFFNYYEFWGNMLICVLSQNETTRCQKCSKESTVQSYLQSLC